MVRIHSGPPEPLSRPFASPLLASEKRTKSALYANSSTASLRLLSSSYAHRIRGRLRGRSRFRLSGGRRGPLRPLVLGVAMPVRAAGLSAVKVKAAAPGRYGDGDGLFLLVRGAESAFWLFRWTRTGRMREMGLGRARGANAVTLAEAREKAGRLYRMVRDGLDPLAERDREAAESQARTEAAAVRAITFKDVATDYIAANAAGWDNPKHRAQWTATLNSYAYPHLGAVPVAEVATSHVIAALEPIWTAKPETASRLRGRIEAVLTAATVKGLRSGDNPARWRGHLAELLPARSKVAPVEHHAALPFADLPTFFLRLQAADGMAARALELAILTAGRTNEVLGATWAELNLDAALWTIPAARMKARREHRVPLSVPALALLRKLQTNKQGAHVFAGQKQGKPLSNMALLMTLRRMKRADLTAHGFRSTFRDWAAESTGHPSEVVEMALAHAVGDKVEAAYRRGDLFEKRRKLMNDWGGYCTGPAPKAPAALSA
jgi:integrase